MSYDCLNHLLNCECLPPQAECTSRKCCSSDPHNNYTYIYILIVEKFACFSSSLWAGEGIDRHLMQFNNVLSLERNIPEDQILLSFGPHAACQLKNEILVDSCILSKDLK